MQILTKDFVNFISFCLLLPFCETRPPSLHQNTDTTTLDYKDELFNAMAKVYKILEDHAASEKQEANQLHRKTGIGHSHHETSSSKKSKSIVGRRFYRKNDELTRNEMLKITTYPPQSSLAETDVGVDPKSERVFWDNSEEQRHLALDGFIATTPIPGEEHQAVDKAQTDLDSSRQPSTKHRLKHRMLLDKFIPRTQIQGSKTVVYYRPKEGGVGQTVIEHSPAEMDSKRKLKHRNNGTKGQIDAKAPLKLSNTRRERKPHRSKTARESKNALSSQKNQSIHAFIPLGNTTASVGAASSKAGPPNATHDQTSGNRLSNRAQFSEQGPSHSGDDRPLYTRLYSRAQDGASTVHDALSSYPEAFVVGSSLAAVVTVVAIVLVVRRVRKDKSGYSSLPEGADKDRKSGRRKGKASQKSGRCPERPFLEDRGVTLFSIGSESDLSSVDGRTATSDFDDGSSSCDRDQPQLPQNVAAAAKVLRPRDENPSRRLFKLYKKSERMFPTVAGNSSNGGEKSTPVGLDEPLDPTNPFSQQ